MRIAIMTLKGFFDYDIALWPRAKTAPAPGAVFIKTYTGRQGQAMALYQADSIKMAAQGYFPVSQSWVPGAYSGGDFLGALLLCLLLIGILVFIYMLVVKPPGTLSVTYELRVEGKTCPQCAEQVKGAALVCRFCGHEFVRA
jgi:hypothetical protein